jgi:hypothetical protein
MVASDKLYHQYSKLNSPVLPVSVGVLKMICRRLCDVQRGMHCFSSVGTALAQSTRLTFVTDAQGVKQLSWFFQYATRPAKHIQ